MRWITAKWLPKDRRWDYTDIDECNMFDNWNMMNFRGFVKSKEELVKLMEQLNIKI